MFHLRRPPPWYMFSAMTSCHQYHYIPLRQVDKGMWSASVPHSAVPKTQHAPLWGGGACACEGQRRILGEDRTVNYSGQKVPLVAHNPIAKAWFASVLDCAAFNGINLESVSWFVVWTRSVMFISGKQNRNMWGTLKKDYFWKKYFIWEKKGHGKMDISSKIFSVFLELSDTLKQVCTSELFILHFFWCRRRDIKVKIR